MDLLIECVLAIDQEDAYAFPGEQASALETGESCADDGYVEIAQNRRSKALCITKFTWTRLRLRSDFRQALYPVKSAYNTETG